MTATVDPQAGASFTNEQLGSVQVTKTFNFGEAALNVPEAFKITASWTIPAAGENGQETTITAYLKTGETIYTLPSETTLPAGVVIERTGDGTSTTPYAWTISNLPIGTGVTFTEFGYEIAGYNVATAVSPESGKATAAVTPDTVAITNTYTPGVELPATGGPGTLVYTVTGLTLTLGAALWLILSRRKREQN